MPNHTNKEKEMSDMTTFVFNRGLLFENSYAIIGELFSERDAWILPGEGRCTYRIGKIQFEKKSER